MKFNKYKISHYFIFIISGINYLIAIILRSLIRNKKNRILLYGHKLVGNLEVIFKDSRFAKHEIMFITLNFSDYLKLKKIYGNRILTPLSTVQLFKCLSSKLTIASHGIFFHKIIKRLGIQTILCGHAINGSIPNNKNKTKKYFEMFDQVLLHSPYDKKIVENELLVGNSNLNTTGFARNQIMVENSFKKKELKSKNNLSNKKIIIYAPTSNRGSKKYMGSTFSVHNINFYRYISKELLDSEIVFIIKTHVNDSISKEIIEFVKENKQIYFDKDILINYDYDLLIISDVLITDLSTIYVDYLLLEKPIYLFDNPDPDPKRELSSILKNINLPKIKTQEELKNFIQKVKSDSLEFQNINKLKQEIYESQDHLDTIEKIDDIFSSISN